MAENANVSSLDAMYHFRSALIEFGEDAEASLTAVEMDVQRFVDWLRGEQLPFWEHQVVKFQERVVEAKSELHRKKLTATFGEHRSVVEEQVALKKMKLRMEQAEEKVQKVRKWLRAMQEAMKEYQGMTQPLKQRLEEDYPKTIGTFDQKLRAIEAYAETSGSSGFSGSSTSNITTNTNKNTTDATTTTSEEESSSE